MANNKKIDYAGLGRVVKKWLDDNSAIGSGLNPKTPTTRIEQGVSQSTSDRPKTPIRRSRIGGPLTANRRGVPSSEKGADVQPKASTTRVGIGRKTSTVQKTGGIQQKTINRGGIGTSSAKAKSNQDAMQKVDEQSKKKQRKNGFGITRPAGSVPPVKMPTPGTKRTTNDEKFYKKTTSKIKGR